MSARVFVYGSLRQGASNHWRMEGAGLLGLGKVAGTLVKISWYPGLILGGVGEVRGEVYEVSQELLGALDAFEGVGVGDGRNGEYARVQAEVLLESGEMLACWVYEWLLGTEGYERVVSGDWLSI